MSADRHYAFIPKTTLHSDKYKELTTHAKLLYVFMACQRKGQDEWFTYSYTEIRKDTGYKYNTIADCIRKLSAKGFIEYKHGGLEVNNNIYYMEPSWLEL